ncbi:MAG: PIG-L deacetylase family protein [Candidatus Sericytochromatia bacterium]
MTALAPFPTDWQSMLVLMPHPDDPEYGMSAAVAKWTAAGKTVKYVMATYGEAGIEGMSRAETATVREAEQRRSAAIVGVADVQFWDFPDGELRDCDELRAAIAAAIAAAQPDLVVTIFGGSEWAPGAPNQRDHIEFAAAVRAVCDRRLFFNGPNGTHAETVDEFIDLAVDSLAAHEKYLSVLDPKTPVAEQARKQVNATTPPHPAFGGRRIVEFILCD